MNNQFEAIAKMVQGLNMSQLLWPNPSFYPCPLVRGARGHGKTEFQVVVVDISPYEMGQPFRTEDPTIH